MWLADQNALRGQFRLGRVVEVTPDKKGVVRDVKVRTCLSCPAGTGKRLEEKSAEKSLFTVLSRDVRRLVVLMPVEEQGSEEREELEMGVKDRDSGTVEEEQ